MYASASFKEDPISRYKVHIGLKRLLVEYSITNETNETIYRWKRPEIRKNWKNPMKLENTTELMEFKDPNEIFYDEIFNNFFSHEIEPGETYRILVLYTGCIEDSYTDSCVIKCSGEMGFFEHLFHRRNIGKISELDNLTPYTRGQIISKYMNGFIKDNSLPENFRDMPDFTENLIKEIKKSPKVPENIQKWAIKEATKMMKIQARIQEINARGGQTSSTIYY